MPVTTVVPKKQTMFTWDDIAKAGWRILIPAGVAGLGWYLFSQDEDSQLFSRLKAPDWVITNPTILGAMNVLAVAPVGFAGYLVDEGSPGSDRDLALYATGAGIVMGMTSYLVTKSKCLKTMFASDLLGTAVAGAMAFTYYKVNKNAGMLLLPLTVFLGYQTISMAMLIQYNPKA